VRTIRRAAPYILSALLSALVLSGVALAQTVSDPTATTEPGTSLGESTDGTTSVGSSPVNRSALVAGIRRLRPHVNGLLRNRCRSPYPIGVPASRLPLQRTGWLVYAVGEWKTRHYRAHRVSSRCAVSTTAIIRTVFGPTAWAALRVAYCETGGTMSAYARNQSSGAAGLFQLMPFHWLGKFNPYDPWANSRYAYRLSSGGYDWHAWVCKP
jgi:hypothetical protein